MEQVVFSSLDLDIGPSRQALVDSAKEGGIRNIFEAAMRYTNAVGSAAYYSLSGLRTTVQLGKITLAYIGQTPNNQFVKFFEQPGISTALQGLGLATSGITLAQESISLFRQGRLLNLFRKSQWQEQLTGLNDLQGKLEKTLPRWLYAKYGKKAKDEMNISHLFEQMNKPQAQAMLREVKEITQKKALVHTLGWISCLICVIGFMGLCPPATAGVLIAIGFALWILRWTLHQGLVENPNGGFSLRHLLQGKREAAALPA